jgi:hypothetical protein
LDKESAILKQGDSYPIYSANYKYLKATHKDVYDKLNELTKAIKTKTNHKQLMDLFTTPKMITRILKKMTATIMENLSFSSAKDLCGKTLEVFRSIGNKIVAWWPYIFGVTCLGLICILVSFSNLLESEETKNMREVKENRKKITDAFHLTIEELDKFTEESGVKYTTVMDTFGHIFEKIGVDVVHPVMKHLHGVSKELRQLAIVAASNEIKREKKQFKNDEAKKEEIAKRSKDILTGMSTVLASGNKEVLHEFFEELFEPLEKKRKAKPPHSPAHSEEKSKHSPVHTHSHKKNHIMGG